MWRIYQQIYLPSSRRCIPIRSIYSISNIIRWYSDDSAKSTGYQSIGSFHSENIETLISLPKTDYQSPPLPPELPTLPVPSASLQDVQSDFIVTQSKNWTFLNHGAFGAALQCGHIRSNQWRDYLELQPLRYFDRTLLPHLTYSVRYLADFVNGDPRSMTLLPNVTSGMNAVLSGYCKHRACKKNGIFYFDVSYGSTKKMMQVYADNKIELVEILVPFPIVPSSTQSSHSSYSVILEELLDHAISKQKAKGMELQNSLLILDHITSNTGLVLPIEKLAKRAKEEGMIVVVDGAHGTLSLDLNMDQIMTNDDNHKYRYIDIYLSNAHKWLSSPRGAGFVYCNKHEFRETLLRYPAIVSHGVDDGFLSRFIWDGCRDYSSALSLPTILDYWNRKNPDKVRTINHTLLLDAISRLAYQWHSSSLPSNWMHCDTETQENVLLQQQIILVPTDMNAFMALIRLPTTISGKNIEDSKSSTEAKKLQDYLYSQNIEVPIKCIQGVLYVRISCHIYNTLEQYDVLGRTIQALIKIH